MSALKRFAKLLAARATVGNRFRAPVIGALVVLGVAGVLPLAAGAAVLDFEALSSPGHPLFPSGIGKPYLEDGFSITAGGGEAMSRWGTDNPRYLGSTMLFNNTLPGTTTITEQNNALFNITQITLARVNNSFLANSETFEGVKFDNSVVSVTFNLPGGDPTLNIITFFFPGTFTDLKSVSWSQDQSSNNIVQVDNIVVAASVPVPGVALVFGGAVGLMLRHARRVPG